MSDGTDAASWISGFLAATYLFAGRYDDYAVLRDTYLKPSPNPAGEKANRMPDISKCADDDCPSRMTCWRRQSYIVSPRDEGAERCSYYWEARE